jgi:aerobic-type carbon monoxide dehydrogenase small subunit (CoxS/CutS family)
VLTSWRYARQQGREGEEMASTLRIRVNGKVRKVESSPDTPLLYVLTDELQLQGPRFGCGLAQCGSCSVLLDGSEIRSCVTPVSAANGKPVITLEGLPQWYAEQRKLAKAPELHPIQQAVIDEQAVQCGYCYNGMMIRAADLLSKIPRPNDRQIREAMNGHLCRCGSYPRMMQAIRRASEKMHGGRTTAESAGASDGAENELAANAATDGAEVAR